MIQDLYTFRRNLDELRVFFYFSGPVSYDLVVELGDTLKQKLRLEKAKLSTVVSVFSMVVELSQNIMHYSSERERMSGGVEDDEEGNLRIGTLVVGYEGSHYFVCGGNLIDRAKVDSLKGILEKIRKMNKEELRKYYRESLHRKGSGGAPGGDARGTGLGFIEMARKSAKPFDYSFRNVDNRHAFFSLKTVI